MHHSSAPYIPSVQWCSNSHKFGINLKNNDNYNNSNDDRNELVCTVDS